MKKMLFSMVMAMLLLQSQGDSITIDGLTWNYRVSNGEVQIYKKLISGATYNPAISKNTSGKIVVPAVIAGVPVTSIGDGSFKGCSLLSGVEIPNGVKDIGSSAFSGCSLLANITIPVSVLDIGSNAFSLCDSLSEIEIHSAVTNIGAWAFRSSGITNAVVLGTGLYHLVANGEDMSSSPFRGCSNLVKVTTRDTCAYMFKECDKLQKVELLDGMENIKEYSFHGCSFLTNVTIPNSVTNIGEKAFLGCSSLIEISIPNSVTKIDNNAFSACSSLARVEIRNSKTSVGESSFAGCSSVVDIAIPEDICNKKIADFFETYQMITNIIIAEGVSKIEDSCFQGCKSISQLSIPASVTRIADNAFLDCSSLEEIIFEGDAPTLGANVFEGVPRRMKIRVKEGSVGWNGTASSELPEYWNGFSISYLSGSDDDTPGSSGGNNQNPPSGGEMVGIDSRYDLAEDIADRAIANVEIDGDTAIDSFILKDGKVYDAVVRIVNVSAADVKVSLPADYKYEKFKGTNPLVIPASSTNLLTITRTKGDTFLLSREELVLEEQK